MTNVVQPHTGASIKPGPMITVVTERSVNDDTLGSFASGSGLNPAFVADQLAASVTHDRMGVNLFRMLAERANNPATISMFNQLRASAEASVGVWEELITTLGGNPQYASPMARMTEGMDAKKVEALLLDGSTDPLSFESAALMAAYTAECVCLVNAETLESFAERCEPGPAKITMTQAANQLLTNARMGQQLTREALDKSMALQAKSSLVQKVGQIAEQATAAVKNTLT